VPSGIAHDKLFLFPGDFIFILRTYTKETSDYVCLLIASFVWREGGKIGERLVWLDSTNTELSEDVQYLLKVLCWVPIQNMPQFCDKYTPKFIKHGKTEQYNKGVMDDGTPYVIYKFLLYSDGFKQKNHFLTHVLFVAVI